MGGRGGLLELSPMDFRARSMRPRELGTSYRLVGAPTCPRLPSSESAVCWCPGPAAVSETKEQKGEASIVMYTYKHHCDKGLDIHEIFVKKSRTRVLLSYVGVVFLLANVCRPLLAKESLCLGSLWSITFGILVAKCLQYKPVKKESVVIMPAFGVQLEIHFWSGRVHRRFVPISKILKPLLNECVTPVTCYWSLALLLRDEEELMLVFQKCRPPVKMLVPIWNALCSFTSSECRSPSAVSLNRTVWKHGSFGAIV